MRRVASVLHHLEPVATSSLAGAPAPLFENQVVIVTGSGQGIGKEAAILFAAHGAAVVVSDLDAAKSDAVAKEIVDAGGRAISFPGDVTVEERFACL
jgi:3-oxoacyl-[acyl-carrier protein] reductase